MATKSNPKTRLPRKSRPASKPANIGITPTMRAREIINIYDLSDGEEYIWLDPVTIHVFFHEVQAMKHARYGAAEIDGHGVCPNCDAQTAVDVSYFQRHRNGKKNSDTQRGFEVCLECHMVTEVILRDVVQVQLDHEHQDVTEIQPN